MDPNEEQAQNPVQIPVNPVSSGRPEAGPIQEVERPVSSYTSYPSAPTTTPVLKPTPEIKISDDIASQPSLKSVNGNVIDFNTAKEKFKKGPIEDSGTWESGVIVSQADRKAA